MAETENKDRLLADVLADFRASYQQVLTAINAMSEESLNAPFPWRPEGRPVWNLIAGNTYEHYEEHGNIIKGWLARSEVV